MKTRWMKILVIASVFTFLNTGLSIAHPVNKGQMDRQRNIGKGRNETNRHHLGGTKKYRRSLNHHKHYRWRYNRKHCKPRGYFYHHRPDRRHRLIHPFIFGFSVVDPKGSFSFGVRSRR